MRLPTGLYSKKAYDVFHYLNEIANLDPNIFALAKPSAEAVSLNAVTDLTIDDDGQIIVNFLTSHSSLTTENKEVLLNEYCKKLELIFDRILQSHFEYPKTFIDVVKSFFPIFDRRLRLICTTNVQDLFIKIADFKISAELIDLRNTVTMKIHSQISNFHTMPCMRHMRTIKKSEIMALKRFVQSKFEDTSRFSADFIGCKLSPFEEFAIHEYKTDANKIAEESLKKIYASKVNVRNYRDFLDFFTESFFTPLYEKWQNCNIKFIEDHLTDFKSILPLLNVDAHGHLHCFS